MTDEVDLDAMFAEMDRAADRAERTLNGRFSQIYRQLRALSPEEIDEITPDTTDQREYERLMMLVQEASERNLEQAELIERIRGLGDVAKRIAQKVGGLKGLV